MDESDEVSIANDNVSFKEQEWRKEHETILVEWADKAMCYRWLHGKSHAAYSSINAWFTIPVIIMSTLTGTANFAQDRFPEDIKPLAQMTIGTVNIFAGILTTIAQFLKVGELNEAHRVSAISWDKFYRNIKVELAKSREERMHVGNMLKVSKEEFDRLMETSPSINEKIIKQFNNTFPAKKPLPSNNPMEDCLTGDIKRPEICDVLVSTADFVFQPDPEIELRKPALLNLVKKNQRKIIDGYKKDISDWSLKFENKHNRQPLESELLDNLQDTMNPDLLKKYVKEYLESNELDKGDDMV